MLCRPPHLFASGKLDDFWCLTSKSFFQRKVCLVSSRSLMSPGTKNLHVIFCSWNRSLCAFYTPVKSRVYWVIHHLTSQWSLVGFQTLCPLTAISSTHTPCLSHFISYDRTHMSAFQWFFLTSRRTVWFSASVCGWLHKHKDHFFIAKWFYIFSNGLVPMLLFTTLTLLHVFWLELTITAFS